MSVWILWMMAAAAAVVSYNVAMKLTGPQVPLWFYMLASSAGFLLAGIGLLLTQGWSSQQWDWVSAQRIGLAGFVVVSLVAVEITLFKMYAAHAPLALSQIFITAVMTIALLVIGYFWFKEVITPWQALGILLAAIGAILIVNR